MKIKVQATSPLTKAHKSDAAYDLFPGSPGKIVILPHSTATVSTGIKVKIPNGYFGAIFSRSGLAAKLGVCVLNAPGVIDPGYEGEVQVILHNNNSHAVGIEPGTAIAQLAVLPTADITFTPWQVEESSERGENGLGSSSEALGELEAQGEATA